REGRAWGGRSPRLPTPAVRRTQLQPPPGRTGPHDEGPLRTSVIDRPDRPHRPGPISSGTFEWTMGRKGSSAPLPGSSAGRRPDGPADGGGQGIVRTADRGFPGSFAGGGRSGRSGRWVADRYGEPNGVSVFGWRDSRTVAPAGG